MQHTIWSLLINAKNGLRFQREISQLTSDPFNQNLNTGQYTGQDKAGETNMRSQQQLLSNRRGRDLFCTQTCPQSITSYKHIFSIPIHNKLILATTLHDVTPRMIEPEPEEEVSPSLIPTESEFR